MTRAEKISIANKGRHLSPQTEFKKGKNHKYWKGKLASYKAFHIWLERYYGKPKECENCNSKIAKRYDWALIKGKDYDHKRENFKRLCRSCHLKYDYTDKRKNNLANSLRGRKNTPEVILKMSEIRRKWWVERRVAI